MSASLSSFILRKTSLSPNLVPFQVAVFPLVSKDNLDKIAKNIYRKLKENFEAVYDDSGSIGKRYYREDERGTPFAVTIDYDTVKDESVTLRSRDTTEQVRIKINDLKDKLLKEFPSAF